MPENHPIERRNAETIGERIRRLREQKGLTQSALTGPGVTGAHVSRIEAGKREPSIKAIRRIARKLEVSPEYLETGVDITTREELELALADMELRIRLDTSDEAIERDLRALITLAQREGAHDVVAKARAALGTTAAGWGRVSEAVEQLEEAIAHPLMRPDVFPDVYATLARAYCSLGRTEDAVALCERAISEAEDSTPRTILATELSQTLSDIGDFERAERVLEEYAGDLENANPYARARIHWSLARVAATRDDRLLALRHLRTAISLLKGTEDTLRLARAHVLCAGILLWGGSTTGVAKHLRAARALFPAHAEANDWGILRGHEALLAARQDRMEEANMAADEALELLPEHTFEQASALYAKALAFSAHADYDAADEAYQRVLTLAERGKLWREAALIARDRADMLRWAGKPYEAERMRQQAGDYVSRIGVSGATSTRRSSRS